MYLFVHRTLYKCVCKKLCMAIFGTNLVGLSNGGLLQLEICFPQVGFCDMSQLGSVICAGYSSSLRAPRDL